MFDCQRFVRPEVLRIAPYNSGLTIAEVKQRYAPLRIAKLGSNENPFGASPAVLPLFHDAAKRMHIYPDPVSHDLREAVAERMGASTDRVMIGNGSEDVLAILSRAIIREGDRVVTLYPSFPLHEDYPVLMGGRIDRVHVNGDLTINVAALIEALKTPCRMLIFSNPMNPVGSWLSGTDLEAVIAAAGPDTVIVIDEAYAEYADGPDFRFASELLRSSPNPWIVLRTFSKAYGLAAARVGYGLFSDPGLCALVDRVRTPFNVNALAQAAALVALQDKDHLAKIVQLTQSERTRLSSFLHDTGLHAPASKGNFLFVDCGGDAVSFAEALLHEGVIVKPWKQAGFDTYARVSIGSTEENSQFMGAIKSMVRSEASIGG